MIQKWAPILAGKFVEWGRALVDWVAQRLPALLQSLGDAAGKIGAWIVNTGLPQLVTALSNWGRAFIGWIGPQVGPALAALGDLVQKIGVWVINTGLPKLAGAMGELGRAAVAAVMDFLVGSHGQTGLLQATVNWFMNTFIPGLPGLAADMASGLASFAGDVGRGILNGLVDMLKGMGQAILDAIKGALNWALSQKIKVGPISIGLSGVSIDFGGGGNASGSAGVNPTTKQKSSPTPLGGGRASGGPVSAGTAYMVGERGPEPFIPGTAGTIIPNGALGGTHITIGDVHLHGVGNLGSLAAAQAIGTQVRDAIARALQEDGARFSEYSGAR
jgi:hypothetical protein